MKISERIFNIDGKPYFFDKTRNKNILVTPEEWVRQNFIDYLIFEKKYSPNLISQESGIKYNKLLKRTDIVCYDRNGTAFLLVECKAESIKLNDEVLAQASRYNKILKAPYLCVTNGKETYCFKIDHENNASVQVLDIPEIV